MPSEAAQSGLVISRMLREKEAMFILTYLATIVWFVTLGALAYFCTLLARREQEIAWGYWLASIVLALHALGVAYAGTKSFFLL